MHQDLHHEHTSHEDLNQLRSERFGRMWTGTEPEIETGNSSKNNVSSIERATQSACENA